MPSSVMDATEPERMLCRTRKQLETLQERRDRDLVWKMLLLPSDLLIFQAETISFATRWRWITRELRGGTERVRWVDLCCLKFHRVWCLYHGVSLALEQDCCDSCGLL